MDRVGASAQAIADALAPTQQAPSARWRWGTVVSVANDGTMNVSIGGSTVAGVRCAQHVMGAQVGDRVRVLYCGTECMVDAVRATSGKARKIGGASVTGGTVQAIYECVKSYLRHGNELAYTTHSAGHNAWDYDTGPEVVTNEHGVTGWAINCSSFVHLVLTGTLYENSMYNTGNGLTNIFGGAGYCFNMYRDAVTVSNYTECMFARDMCRRMFDLGLAEYCAGDYSNIGPGDILFYSSYGEFTPPKTTHISIVLSSAYIQYEDGATKGMYLTAEASDSEQVISVRATTCEMLESRGVFAVGHPVYQSKPEHALDVIADIESIKTSAKLEMPFDANEMDVMTLEFDFTPSSTSNYVNVRVNDNNLISAYPLRYATVPRTSDEVGRTRHFVLPFPTHYYGGMYAPITYIRIYSFNGDSSGNELRNVRLYNGLGAIGRDSYDAVSASSLTAFRNAIVNKMPSDPTCSANWTFDLPIIPSVSVTLGSVTVPAGETVRMHVDAVATNGNGTRAHVTGFCTAGKIDGLYDSTKGGGSLNWTWS